jgi:large-conductance mechanosensitive channel
MDELPDPDLGSRPTRSRRVRKKKLDDLLDPSLVLLDPSRIEPSEPSSQPPPTVDLIPPGSSEYKNKLKVYVLSGQIKDLYGKIITEHELNKMSEQECENVYKICELKMAQRISGSVVDGIITVVGNLCSKTLPIENKDKYIAELKSDYIINSELKNVAGNIAMRTGRLMGVLEFLITASNIKLYKKNIQELDKELDKDAQELEQELAKELDSVLQT